MASVNQDVNVFRGEIVTVNWTMNPPANITGWTLLLTVALALGQQQKLFTKTPTITDGPSGRFKVDFTATDTNLAAGSYVYDVWRTTTGNERVLALGAFTIVNSVRKP